MRGASDHVVAHSRTNSMLYRVLSRLYNISV
jgi:hypothetical protein